MQLVYHLGIYVSEIPLEEPVEKRMGKHRIIGVMVYGFARVGAVVGMNVEDYFQQGKRWWFRLHEKGGKRHEVPTHHNAKAYLDAYLEASGISDDKKGPLPVPHNSTPSSARGSGHDQTSGKGCMACCDDLLPHL